MGYGAYMNVTNSTSNAITTLINDVNCMYDNGQEGSNLSLFNNVTIQPGQTLPGGQGQYIEAKASGSCAFQASNFTFQIVGGASVQITESSNNYYGNSVSGIGVNINNSGDQAIITLTVYTPGSAEGAEFEAALASAQDSPVPPPPPAAPGGTE